MIHGVAGGTGAMIAQLAKIAGVGKIYGTCSGKNLAAATAQGVTAFDYSNGDWHKRVLEATGGKGVDAVFDAVVTNGYTKKGFACLKRGGRYVPYGATNSASPGAFSIWALVPSMMAMGMQNAFWSWFDGKTGGFLVPSAGEGKSDSASFGEDLVKLMDMVASGQLDPVIGKVWTFEQAKDALASIEANAHTGKQIIRVAEA